MSDGKKASILIIEDERIMRITLEDSLKGAGYEVISREMGRDGLEAVKSAPFDLIVMDVRLPDGDGISLINEIKRWADAEIIVITAFGSIRDAVQAMKLGAFDYITKPFSLDEFMMIVERALSVKRLRDENIRLRRDLSRCYSIPHIVGESVAMKHVLRAVEMVALSDATVLLLGESGTGKELIATTIHYQSRRRDRPFIKVNCAAFPEGLIESELFGYERGAFTGALKRKPGRFELADGGTIFLDEIGDLPLSTQVKLLRVLQERSFERLGGKETISVDVRIIAATNRDLEEEVRNRGFREDLFFRISVIPIRIPPLRERKEDIPYLLDFFLKKQRARTGKDVRFSEGAIQALLKYEWPGNVRELENVVERCVILSEDGWIDVEDLPLYIQGESGDGISFNLSDAVTEAEKDHIIKILKLTRGNRTKAAQLLGISRKTLWEKIKTYGIKID